MISSQSSTESLATVEDESLYKDQVCREDTRGDELRREEVHGHNVCYHPTQSRVSDSTHTVLR
jgi:hypothetical protein